MVFASSKSFFYWKKVHFEEYLCRFCCWPNNCLQLIGQPSRIMSRPARSARTSCPGVRNWDLCWTGPAADSHPPIGYVASSRRRPLGEPRALPVPPKAACRRCRNPGEAVREREPDVETRSSVDNAGVILGRTRQASRAGQMRARGKRLALTEARGVVAGALCYRRVARRAPGASRKP